MYAKKIIEEIKSLPIEERALIADSILKSINPVKSSIDKKWVTTAKIRLEGLRAEKVKSIRVKKFLIKSGKKILYELLIP